MLLAPAIAFLALDGIARGFAPWEKTILAALWIVPLVARSVPEATLIPLAVPTMLLAFVTLLHRAMNECGAPRPVAFCVAALKIAPRAGPTAATFFRERAYAAFRRAAQGI